MNNAIATKRKKPPSPKLWLRKFTCCSAEHVPLNPHNTPYNQKPTRAKIQKELWVERDEPVVKIRLPNKFYTIRKPPEKIVNAEEQEKKPHSSLQECKLIKQNKHKTACAKIDTEFGNQSNPFDKVENSSLAAGDQISVQSSVEHLANAQYNLQPIIAHYIQELFKQHEVDLNSSYTDRQQGGRQSPGHISKGERNLIWLLTKKNIAMSKLPAKLISWIGSYYTGRMPFSFQKLKRQISRNKDMQKALNKLNLPSIRHLTTRQRRTEHYLLHQLTNKRIYHGLYRTFIGNYRRRLLYETKAEREKRRQAEQQRVTLQNRMNIENDDESTQQSQPDKRLYVLFRNTSLKKSVENIKQTRKPKMKMINVKPKFSSQFDKLLSKVPAKEPERHKLTKSSFKMSIAKKKVTIVDVRLKPSLKNIRPTDKLKIKNIKPKFTHQFDKLLSKLPAKEPERHKLFRSSFKLSRPKEVDTKPKFSDMFGDMLRNVAPEMPEEHKALKSMHELPHENDSENSQHDISAEDSNAESKHKRDSWYSFSSFNYNPEFMKAFESTHEPADIAHVENFTGAKDIKKIVLRRHSNQSVTRSMSFYERNEIIKNWATYFPQSSLIEHLSKTLSTDTNVSYRLVKETPLIKSIDEMHRTSDTSIESAYITPSMQSILDIDNPDIPLEEKIKRLMKYLPLTEDVPEPKPKRNFVQEAQMRIWHAKPIGKTTEVRRTSEMFPTRLDRLPMPKELRQMQRKPLKPMIVRRYCSSRRFHLIHHSQHKLPTVRPRDCPCNICDFGRPVPDSPLIHDMKQKWQRVQLKAYSQLFSQQQLLKAQSFENPAQHPVSSCRCKM